MRPLARTIACVALLAAWLTGCSNLHIPFRQQPQAPPLQTGQGSLEAQEKKQHEPPPPFPPQIAQTTPASLPPVRVRKVKHDKRSRRTEPETTQPTEIAQAAPTNPPVATQTAPATSAIGQLTAGDSATEAQTTRDTETLITETDQGLAAIKRTLSKDEQTTAAQIRTFLKQAKQALANGDSDGAHGLATKAKLLLDELTKP